MALVPHPYSDPYFGGLFSVYGPQTINIEAHMGSHMFGITPTRVPLPLDLTEDEPVYVNAKQYHGILRRRQSRAKLEAQNKLVKNRKPYLHESRHLHAVNRVRGSGGRFLSAKKNQLSHDLDPSDPANEYSNDLCRKKDNAGTGPTGEHVGNSTQTGTHDRRFSRGLTNSRTIVYFSSEN